MNDTRCYGNTLFLNRHDSESNLKELIISTFLAAQSYKHEDCIAVADNPSTY